MSIRAQSLASHLHCLNSSPNAHFPLPPCLSERNHSSPASSMTIQARMLVSHLDHVYLSSVARLPPPPSQIEPERSLPTSTMSIRVQSLVSHLDPGYSSSITHLPPVPCPFKPEHSSPTSTISIHVRMRALALLPWPHHVHSSATARFSPPLSILKPQCLLPSPTVFIRAQMLVRPP